MKILNIHKNVTNEEIVSLVSEKLNPLFKEQRQTDIKFIVENKDGHVEIAQPEMYEGFLFRIEPRGTELYITRSEHYVDDVNSITVESILNLLFEDLAGDKGIAIVLEG